MRKLLGILLNNKWAALAVLGILLAVFSLRSGGFDFLADDAFISFRYAQNLVEGKGLVFNEGEKVEGYTNFLYVVLVAAFHAAGIDPVLAGRSLGLAAALLLICSSWFVVRRLTEGAGWYYAAAAATLLSLNAYLAVWGLGGLETTLFSFFILASAAPLVLVEISPRPFMLTSLFSSAAALTRPEGALVYVALLCFAFFSCGGSLKKRIACCLPGLTAFMLFTGTFYLWRFFYYKEWLPNTYYAKSAFTVHHFHRGWKYIYSFAHNVYVLPALVLGLAGFVARRTKELSLFLILLAVLVFNVLAVGGDGLPAYRFIVPGLAPLFIAASLGAYYLAARFAGKIRAAFPLVLLACVAVGGGMRRDVQYHLYDYQKSYEVPTWSAVGRWLAANMPKGTLLAAVPIGAVSYYSQLPMIDMMGLTDKHIARVEVDSLGRGWSGHEKTDGAYVLSRHPDILLLGNILVSDVRAHGFQVFYPPYMNVNIFAREEDILNNPIFWKSYRLASFQIGEKKYLNCFMRKN